MLPRRSRHAQKTPLVVSHNPILPFPSLRHRCYPFSPRLLRPRRDLSHVVPWGLLKMPQKHKCNQTINSQTLFIPIGVHSLSAPWNSKWEARMLVQASRHLRANKFWDQCRHAWKRKLPQSPAECWTPTLDSVRKVLETGSPDVAEGESDCSSQSLQEMHATVAAQLSKWSSHP